MGLVAGGGWSIGCHRGAPDKAAEAAPRADAVKRDLAGVKSQLGDLTARFTDLRKQVEAVPPNLPGFPETRAKFYATEEGRGVMDAKLTILASQLDAAVSSGKGAELLKVSKDIAETRNELGQIEQNTRGAVAPGDGAAADGGAAEGGLRGGRPGGAGAAGTDDEEG
jgi:hypothetical protein